MIIIKNIIRKKHFKLLRAQLKGARKLRKENRPFFVEQVYNDLAKLSFGLNEKDFPSSLVGAHGLHAESMISQRLLARRSIICAAIMQSIGSGKPAILPAPDSWVNSLESNGIQVNRLGCKLSLYKFAMFNAFKGIVKTVLLMLQYKLPVLTGKPYTVFMNLISNNLPVSGQKKSYDIITWYKKSQIKKPEIEEIWAEVRTNDYYIPPDIYIYQKIFPSFTKWLNFIKYFYKSCISVAVTFSGIIRGKWWYGLLCYESGLLHYINVINNQDLAREYFFHVSTALYRPLWTYEAEKKGADVNLVFYSTNMERFKWKYQRLDSDLIKMIKWRNLIVWDEEQKNFLQQYCPKANFQVVGSIDFVDSSTIFKANGLQFKIAVFDVTPTRPVFYTSLGWAIAPYWSEKLTMRFFNDIGEIVDPNKVNLFWKQKRIVNYMFIDKGFIRKRDLIINKYFTAVHPDISAKRLIDESDAVISMPFTSPSIIGKELGKPSIYFDASGSIEKQNSHGIPVLKNKNELKNWYNSLNIENVSLHA